MVERVDVACQIIRWVSDDPMPGMVEACFEDAAGRVWTLVDKAPIFTAAPIDSRSTYPRTGAIRCEVIGRLSDTSGKDVIRVRAFDGPRNDGDTDVFEVNEAQLVQPTTVVSEWVEVANGLDLTSARSNFSAVLESRGVREEVMNQSDIRIDTIHTASGDRRRIMIRRDVAIRLGL